MPGFDRKGPLGSGPMTGRGMGKCNKQSPENNRDERPQFSNQQGPGLQRGLNGGNGRRFRFGSGVGRVLKES